VTSIENLSNGSAPTEILYLPAGTHTVYAQVGGGPKALEVHVSALTARLLQSDLEELLGSSFKPFIDFDYTGQAAAADPKRFVWKPGEGVFLALEWTRSGRQAVEGKDYRYFSPAFQIDAKGELQGLPANGNRGSGEQARAHPKHCCSPSDVCIRGLGERPFESRRGSL